MFCRKVLGRGFDSRRLHQPSLRTSREAKAVATKPLAKAGNELLLLDKKDDLRTVQALMGHSQHIRATEAYLHSTDERKVEAIRSLQFGV